VLGKLTGALLRIASVIPIRVWTRLGPALARTRPLGWYAGWTFGAAPGGRSPLFRARLLLWSVYRYRRSEVQRVRLAPLDDLVEAEGLGRVDAIKIDAEGGELAVLQGARRILALHRPVILLELFEAALQKQNASREAVLSLLRSSGYTFRVFGPAGSPVPAGEIGAEANDIIALPARGTQHDGRPVERS
jgi:hypothetical protein